MKRKIYLDYNATTPIRPEVIAMMNEAMQNPHNASAVHSYGRKGRKYVEAARESTAKLVNCPATQIIFNSGATEGNNTVLKHFANERVLVSSIEHPSVLEALPHAETIPVTQDGIVDLKALEHLLTSPPAASGDLPPADGGDSIISPPSTGGLGGEKLKTALVSIMLVNNETGVIQPMKDISALVHKHGALLHCDGVQAAGRIEIDMQAMGIDFLTLSAHKIGGPQGVGALCMGLCGETPVLLQGGGQEKSARAGTENVAGIAGFGTAVEITQENLISYTAEMKELLSSLEIELSKINNLTIHGKNVDRVPNTCLFSIPGLSSETLLMALDLEGIAVSNGSACSSGKVEPSHVLKAMGYDDATASAAIRISIGWNTTKEDIDAFLTAFEKILERLDT